MKTLCLDDAGAQVVADSVKPSLSFWGPRKVARFRF